MPRPAGRLLVFQGHCRGRGMSWPAEGYCCFKDTVMALSHGTRLFFPSQLTTTEKCCAIRCCSTRLSDLENCPLIRRSSGVGIPPLTTRDITART
jgi:hypothetical protein